MENKQDIYTEYKKLVEKHNEIFEFYNHLIKFMHNIMESVIVDLAKEVNETKIKKTGIEVIYNIYQMKILNCFMGHYICLKSGVVLPSYASLRTIYENILRIYANLCYEDIAEIEFKYQLMI